MLCRHGDCTNTVGGADALDCQKQTARIIVDRGGEYCIQVKNNQKNIREEFEFSTREPAWSSL